MPVPFASSVVTNSMSRSSKRDSQARLLQNGTNGGASYAKRSTRAQSSSIVRTYLAIVRWSASITLYASSQPSALQSEPHLQIRKSTLLIKWRAITKRRSLPRKIAKIELIAQVKTKIYSRREIAKKEKGLGKTSKLLQIVRASTKNLQLV